MAPMTIYCFIFAAILFFIADDAHAACKPNHCHPVRCPPGCYERTYQDEFHLCPSCVRCKPGCTGPLGLCPRPRCSKPQCPRRCWQQTYIDRYQRCPGCVVCAKGCYVCPKGPKSCEEPLCSRECQYRQYTDKLRFCPACLKCKPACDSPAELDRCPNLDCEEVKCKPDCRVDKFMIFRGRPCLGCPRCRAHCGEPRCKCQNLDECHPKCRRVDPNCPKCKICDTVSRLCKTPCPDEECKSKKCPKACLRMKYVHGYNCAPCPICKKGCICELTRDENCQTVDPRCPKSCVYTPQYESFGQKCNGCTRCDAKCVRILETIRTLPRGEMLAIQKEVARHRHRAKTGSNKGSEQKFEKKLEGIVDELEEMNE